MLDKKGKLTIGTNYNFLETHHNLQSWNVHVCCPSHPCQTSPILQIKFKIKKTFSNPHPLFQNHFFTFGFNSGKPSFPADANAICDYFHRAPSYTTKPNSIKTPNSFKILVSFLQDFYLHLPIHRHLLSCLPFCHHELALPTSMGHQIVL